jgi:hypothetical protein
VADSGNNRIQKFFNTVSGTIISNVTVLDTKIAIAQALYDIATEGVGHGKYASGSKVKFLAAINVALNFNNTFTQAEIDTAVVALNTAIDEFKSKKDWLNEVNEKEIGDLINQGSFVVPVGSSASDTPKLTVATDVTINVGDTSVTNSVVLPKDTEITTNDGSSFNANQIVAELVAKTDISNFDSKFNAKASLQWGILGTTLNFSEPITLNIYVGTEYNGRILKVQRSPEKSDGWTDDGIVTPGTCVITNGYCQFQATKASYYGVLEETVTSSNNNSSSSGSSNSSSPTRVCNRFATGMNPDLFEIRIDKNNGAKLIYSPVSGASEYAVLYGFKKGDERFGAIVNTVNNGLGVQNSLIGSLVPGKTYYFKVAASNGCMASDWSDWIPVKVQKNKTVIKYTTIIKNKIKTLISRFI